MARNFREQVYILCKIIPLGKVTTHTEIARVLGTAAYRAIGQALKRNEDPVGIPCFKVVNSDGSPGGYNGSSLKNVAKKKYKLQQEGIEIAKDKVNLEKYCFKFC